VDDDMPPTSAATRAGLKTRPIRRDARRTMRPEGGIAIAAEPRHAEPLDPARFDRLREAFLRAGDVPLAERSAFLVAELADDPDLLARARRLVERDDADARTAEVADWLNGDSSLQPAHLAAGAHVGRYRLLEPIGHGGFGVVYRAEQQEPVRRPVAVKVLYAAANSTALLARFALERQALAAMDHPHIARVYDAGQTAPELGSQPYVVMELVQGEPIAAYCDSRRFDVRARVGLMHLVAQAVQHAHQRGVIHRDLKPSNILVADVDGVATPKIIDFGIAKATEGNDALGAASDLTRRVDLLGTPRYMSPEQATSSDDLDTRSDVYSLGVVLYELLAGSTPLEAEAIEGVPLPKMLELVRAQVRETPSVRLERSLRERPTIADARGTSPSALVAAVRRDLDWITMKALEADRDARYDSAATFGAELQRWLDGQPVLAGPPTLRYRAGKFFRRNRLAVSAVAGICLALGFGVVVAGLGLLRARESARVTNAVNGFMSEVLTSVYAERQGASVTLADALDAASENASARFEGFPAAEADVRELLARSYAHLGRNERAIPEYAQVVTLRTAAFGPDDARTLHATIGLLLSRLRREGAPSIARDLANLEPRIAAYRDDIGLQTAFLCLTANADTLSGRTSEAERTLRALYARLPVGEQHALLHIRTLEELALTLKAKAYESGRQERDAIMREIQDVSTRWYDFSRRRFGLMSAASLDAQSMLALASNELGDYVGAANACEDLLVTLDRLVAPCHAMRQRVLRTLAYARYRLGEDDKAVRAFDEQLKCLARGGDADITYLSNILDALPFYDRGGRNEEGARLAAVAASGLSPFDGGGHGLVSLAPRLYVAHFTSALGRLDEADALFAALDATPRADIGPVSAAQLEVLRARHELRKGRPDEAERCLDRAKAITGSVERGSSEVFPDDLMAAYADLYEVRGERDRAAKMRQACLSLRRSSRLLEDDDA
jgi:tetratricopeptide (TPR) repeat protein